MSFQQTLKSPISCKGIGLHSGKEVSLTIRPAEAGTGIVFVRTDLETGQNIIPAQWDNVTDTRLCTLISNQYGAEVGTIEHLMAALAGCHVDNAIVELDAPEVPIMDGSSAPFVFLIECTGLVQQTARRLEIKILEPVEYKEGNSWARFTPGPATTFELEIDFQTKAIDRQVRTMQLVENSFKKELSDARTFGFLQEVDALRQIGLCRGGSLENAIVIDGDKIMNEEGLRYEDEFVRHKLLDSIGDLYLAGHKFIGHFEGYRSGHGINNKLLRALFATPSAWCLVEERHHGIKTPISDDQRQYAFA